MSTNPIQCQYCGCQDQDCLVQCAATGLYFCNGKGDTLTSHAVFHLRSLQLDKIALPPKNKFSKIKLQCYICGCTNVFKLGFIYTRDKTSLFIVCSSPCKFHESLVVRGVNTDSFIPFISNGQFYEGFIKVPEPDKYKKIPRSKAQQVTEAIKKKLNKETTDEKIEHIQRAYNTYKDKQKFANIMLTNAKEEMEFNKSRENSQSFKISRFEWLNPVNLKFRCPPDLFKITSIGTEIKIVGHVGDADIEERARVVLRQKDFYVVLRFASQSNLNEATSLKLSAIYNTIVYERQKMALDIFLSNNNALDPVITKCFLGHIYELSKSNTIPYSRTTITDLPSEYFFPLNDSQKLAVQKSLSSHFTLIQGPPGTGKTTTIAAIARSFVANGIKPVLVCAQSNIAADFATHRLLQTGMDIIRLLPKSREEVPNEILKFTSVERTKMKYQEKWAQYESEGKINELKMLEKSVINDADVVCTTCITSGGKKLSKIKFPVVIFDESGQCLDPDLLIPLVHYCKQCVLVGDHKQLGPAVYSQKALKARYDIPLMQRMILNGFRPIVLKTQYRMHPGLSLFPSEHIYGGLLKDGVTKADRQWKTPFINWPNPDIPLIFWNIESQEEYYENGLSYVNRYEAGIIASLIEKMYQAGVKSSDIGVITLYAGQQIYLIDSLPQLCRSVIQDRSYFTDLEIASVDAFQGREKNFIILSNVRANSNYDIGFVKDVRRFCVSLTRAKYGLICLANAKTFSQNKLWCEFIKFCQQQNVFVEGPLNKFKPSTFTAMADLVPEENK